MMECTNSSSFSSELGPFGIHYLSLYCEIFEQAPFVFSLSFILWAGLLFYFIATTADAYLSSTLASISEKLQIPCQVAGVTFLAFGNGAPDIFSSIAAYSSGLPDTGINSLLGGAMFVSNVVAGCVLLSSKPAKHVPSFTRDFSALLLTLMLMGLLAFTNVQEDGRMCAVAFLLMYFVYVSAVVVPECRSRWLGLKDVLSDTKDAPVSSELPAFWHKNGPISMNLSDQKYTFLTMTSLEMAGRFHDRGLHNHTKAQEFEAVIHDQHFEDLETLSAPLIMHGQECDDAPTTEKTVNFSRGARILEGAYWNHLRWRRRIRRRALNEFTSTRSIWKKCWTLPQVFLVLIRDLTIPTIDDDNWSRSLAVVQVIGSPVFIAYTCGLWREQMYLYGWQIALCFGTIFAILISLCTHRSHPPTSPIICALLLTLSFVSCVCWIFTVSGEILALLTALGKATGISNSLLGLTVLSWGNSIGDLITNISVARSGFPDMALAGCFGGPVFNILVGIGLPLALQFTSGRSVLVNFSLDLQARISLLFLVITTLLSLVVFRYCPTKHLKYYGRFLWMNYVFYSLVTIMVTLNGYL
uniref:Ca2: Cation Antiporter (CaCA) Family putative n=1 Tax=Albugo laibachii Nc14 TaxID=890382 RepID=F0WG74_9STRA|nr:Ca2 :Cation Antiporter (CaCA) Family putative [Albugo laibachii Nc14]|eukprot:CCA20209.1 Ca2 :Cation Antiporter (CaCA) Family putative [Albugo laibachii Nc14]